MSSSAPDAPGFGVPTLPGMPATPAAPPAVPQAPAAAPLTPPAPLDLSAAAPSLPSLPSLPGSTPTAPPPSPLDAPPAPDAPTLAAAMPAPTSTLMPPEAASGTAAEVMTLAAPTSAPFAAPSLPTIPSAPAPAAPSAPAPPAPAGLSAPNGAPQPPPPSAPKGAPKSPASSKSPKRRSLLRLLVPVVLVGGLAAVGYFGYQTLTADDAVEPTGVTPASTVAPSSPIVAPINDAEAVVDQINDNSEEDALLEELGIDDAAGESPADLSVGAGLQFTAGDLIDDDVVSALDAPSFQYRYDDGDATQSVWVDASTGNREFFDGTTYVRSTDGAVYVTIDPSAAWTVDADAMPSGSLATVETMMTLDAVLPGPLLSAVAAEAPANADGYGRFVFEDTEFARIDPEARTAWLISWGFDPSTEPVAVDGFTNVVPDTAGPGEILISVSGSLDGIVTNLTIDAPSLGQTVRYTLLGTSADALTIAAPAVIAE